MDIVASITTMQLYYFNMYCSPSKRKTTKKTKFIDIVTKGSG